MGGRTKDDFGFRASFVHGMAEKVANHLVFAARWLGEGK
ncbi:hypothetical protein RISK_002361 [Rhodopirellula islandica]|uniref:Uncharacterized protein n=1 Tax=Rhodopirellula islandica TaxID=595434 RepID=A0A0J1EJN8_RHOIS|nr:hypothetical protein RISK_002361 [Rhodopirellula islandica]